VNLDELCRPFPAELLPPLDRGDQPTTPLQAAYQTDGFVILPGLLAQAVAEYRDWFVANDGQIDRDPQGVGYMTCEPMRYLCSHPLLHDTLAELVGEPMGLHLCLTRWVSTQRNWHQDGYLNPDHVADWYAAVWIALDRIDPDAGPFEYAPGSHRRFGTISHDLMLAALNPGERDANWPKASERILTPLIEQQLEIHDLPTARFVAEPGDVLIWHPRLIHRGSVPNDPLLRRPALIAHYSGITHRPDMPAAQPCDGGWFFPL
jgi:hypothetical protein